MSRRLNGAGCKMQYNNRAILLSEDAPQWLKGEPLREKWAEINNARLRMRKRKEWSQEKTEIELTEMTYHIPCRCDKCGKEFIGIVFGYAICDIVTNKAIGYRRRAIHHQTDCILCTDCNDKLIEALQTFEKKWVRTQDRKDMGNEGIRGTK